MPIPRGHSARTSRRSATTVEAVQLALEVF